MTPGKGAFIDGSSSGDDQPGRLVEIGIQKIFRFQPHSSTSVLPVIPMSRELKLSAHACWRPFALAAIRKARTKQHFQGCPGPPRPLVAKLSRHLRE
jgi:hypothetical protein